MKNLKSIIGIIAALLPIAYCGGLIFYFLDLTGSVEEAKTNGLGPTLLGLGIVGLIFCVPLILKIVRLIVRPRSPGSGGGNDADSGFDADAVIARYKAQQSHESTEPVSRPLLPRSTAPAKHFGRRSR